jgi:hypothetical protein
VPKVSTRNSGGTVLSRLISRPSSRSGIKMLGSSAYSGKHPHLLSIPSLSP